MTLKITFCRHAESLANAGERTSHPKTVGLSTKGQRQASRLKKYFDRKPDEIFVTEYDRTRLTAAPTAEKFRLDPDRLIVLPAHEFTYLDINANSETTERERESNRDKYWNLMNPDHIDGHGAESFNQFIKRLQSTLDYLKSGQRGENVVLFSHGMTMRAMYLLETTRLTGKDLMQAFYSFGQQIQIPNAEPYETHLEGGRIIMPTQFKKEQPFQPA